MASQGARKLAEDRASVEYLMEQYPEEFLGEGWDGEQGEKRRRRPTPDYFKSSGSVGQDVRNIVSGKTLYNSVPDPTK